MVRSEATSEVGDYAGASGFSMPNAGCRPVEFSVEYIGGDGARCAPLAISSHVRFELAPLVHADRSFKVALPLAGSRPELSPPAPVSCAGP